MAMQRREKARAAECEAEQAEIDAAVRAAERADAAAERLAAARANADAEAAAAEERAAKAEAKRQYITDKRAKAAAERVEALSGACGGGEVRLAPPAVCTTVGLWLAHERQRGAHGVAMQPTAPSPLSLAGPRACGGRRGGGAAREVPGPSPAPRIRGDFQLRLRAGWGQAAGAPAAGGPLQGARAQAGVGPPSAQPSTCRAAVGHRTPHHKHSLPPPSRRLSRARSAWRVGRRSGRRSLIAGSSVTRRSRLLLHRWGCSRAHMRRASTLAHAAPSHMHPANASGR